MTATIYGAPWISLDRNDKYRLYTVTPKRPPLGYFYFCNIFSAYLVFVDRFIQHYNQNGQRTYLDKICQLALIGFPHYLTKSVQQISAFLITSDKTVRNICRGLITENMSYMVTVSEITWCAWNGRPS